MFRVLVLLVAACGEAGGGGDGTTDASGPSGAGGATDACADPAYNPFAGTCVVTFLEDCFQPVGECTTTGSMMSFAFSWENGARIEFSLTDIGIFAADGTECAHGVPTIGGGTSCVTTTVYTRTSDGSQQTWCTGADGSLVVTCETGDVIEIDAGQSAAASGCGFGEGGACEPPI